MTTAKVVIAAAAVADSTTTPMSHNNNHHHHYFNNELSSNEWHVRLKALRHLKHSIIPKLDKYEILSLLTDNNNGHNNNLSSILLNMVSNDDKESCREMAIQLFHYCLEQLLMSSSSSSSSTTTTTTTTEQQQQVSNNNNNNDDDDNDNNPNNDNRLAINQFMNQLLRTTYISLLSTCFASSSSSSSSSRSSFQPNENVETIRHDLLLLLHLIVSHTTTTTTTSHDDDGNLINTLGITLSDPYPLIPRTSCHIITVLCQRHQQQQPTTTIAKLSKPLLLLLRHRHSATRLAVLDATDSLFSLVTTTSDMIMEGWMDCYRCDSHVAVREKVISIVGQLIKGCNGVVPPAPLWYILLQAVVNGEEREMVRQMARDFLLVAKDDKWWEEEEEERRRKGVRQELLSRVLSDAISGGGDVISSQYRTRVRVGAYHVLPIVVLGIIPVFDDDDEELTTARDDGNSRCQTTPPSPPLAILPLLSANDDDDDSFLQPPRLDDILSILCTGLRNDDDDEDNDAVRNAARQACLTMGRDKTIIQKVLQRYGLIGDDENDLSSSSSSSSLRLSLSSPRQLASLLTLLACLISGSSLELDADCVSCITTLLSSPRVMEHLNTVIDVAMGVYDVLTSLVTTIPPSSHISNDDNNDSNNESMMLSSIVSLLGCPTAFELYHDTKQNLLHDMAQRRGISHDDLLGRHFESLFYRIIDDNNTATLPWDQPNDSSFTTFDSLLRHSGSVPLLHHADLIIPVFERYFTNLSPSSQPSVVVSSIHLSLMALLQSIVSHSSSSSIKTHDVSRLVMQVLTPPLVWTVGTISSSLRKLTAAALLALFSSSIETLSSSKDAPQMISSLLPLLISNLSDDDATTRQLIAAILNRLFVLMRNTNSSSTAAGSDGASLVMGWDVVDKLYPALLARFDDGSHPVRICACDALKAFLQLTLAESSSWKGSTALRVVVEHLLIHLDDGCCSDDDDDDDDEWKRMVYNVLVVARGLDEGMVRKKAREGRGLARDVRFFDLLVNDDEEEGRSGGGDDDDDDC